MDIFRTQPAEEKPANYISSGGIQLPRTDAAVMGTEHHNRILPIDLLSELI